jgi:hypothetical protein
MSVGQSLALSVLLAAEADRTENNNTGRDKECEGEERESTKR